ncbi:MAG: DUF1572 family protein [Pirellulales bacterium]
MQERDEHLAVAKSVIDGALAAFLSNKTWADKAVAQLSDEKLRVALDPNTNSVAVIMKHVAGNLRSRWTDFLTADGEKPWRNRDDEFVDNYGSRAEILADWESGWDSLFQTLRSLKPGDLSATVTIRGEPHSVPLAIQRSLAHCGYHVGQIMLIARILAGDHWSTITIARGGSSGFNQRVWGQGHYKT